MRCNCYLSGRDGILGVKSLTRQSHRSIPFSVMRYRPLLLLVSILPAGAELAYSQSCPVVTVSCPDSNNGPTLTYSANVMIGDPSPNLTFNWTVSAGKITSGQGTGSITLDKTGFGGQAFTATVKVGGLPQECPNEASCSVLGPCPPPVARKFDEYGSETKAVGLTRPRGTSQRRTRRITNKGKAST